MSAFTDLGYRIVASKPNAEGLCTFRIVDADNAEVARLDEPCTLDAALAAAERFAKQEMQEEE